MRESEIEKRVCAHAKTKGWLAYKFVSPSNRGVPDRLLLRNGVCIFIEFKAEGKKATKLQQKVMSRIEDQEFDCHLVDSVEFGIEVINSYC